MVLDDYSEPEPDLILLRPRDDFYRPALPRCDDALLVVEVSDSTLRYDRDVKLPLYARRCVPEVWIVDLEQRVLIACTDPTDDGYRNLRRLANPGTCRQVSSRTARSISRKFSERLQSVASL
jgi:Uma2 family endonuclease